MCKTRPFIFVTGTSQLAKVKAKLSMVWWFNPDIEVINQVYLIQHQ